MKTMSTKRILLSLVILLTIILAVGLTSCAGVDNGGAGIVGAGLAPRLNKAEIKASCPPLTVAKRTDADGQTRRIAEVEGWYGACRGSIMQYLDAVERAEGVR